MVQESPATLDHCTQLKCSRNVLAIAVASVRTVRLLSVNMVIDDLTLERDVA